MGNRADTLARSWDGQLDELRLYDGTLSNAWIAAEYNNQNDPTSFHMIGTEEISPPTPWYDSNWQLRKEITVDQTLVPSDLIDFPMLVSITDSDLASSAQADGDDILFTAGDGITKLSHEIEKWDDGTGELAAWVKVPNLSSVSNTKLFMYYDNPTVSNQQDTTGGTWRAEYKTVYHLQDDFNDSTSNGNHCTATGTTNAAGAIADSQEFDGIDDILNCHSDPSIDDVWTSGGTMSVWLNPDTAGGQNKGIVFQKTVNSLRINGQSGDDVRLAFVARFDGSWEKWNTSNYPITLDNWHLLHLTYNSDSSSNNPEFWVNATVEPNIPPTVSGTHDGDSPNPLYVGNRADTLARSWDGQLDELRLYDGTLSNAWIAAEYNNQNDPTSFHMIGTEETQ